MAEVTICSDFGAQIIKSATVCTVPSISHEVMGPDAMIFVFITSWQIDGETMETVTDFIFWVPKSLHMVIAAMKLKDACSSEEKL